MALAKFENLDAPQPAVYSPAREHLISKLKNGVVWLKFRKADGSEAYHRATLDDLHIPPAARSTFANRAQNADVVSFYSISRNDWRSFRVDRFISME
jgi:hypothetical protein